MLSGHAAFTVGDDEIDAPAGMCVYISDAGAERVAFAKASGTVILSLGAAAEGTPFTPSGWDTGYLEGA